MQPTSNKTHRELLAEKNVYIHTSQEESAADVSPFRRFLKRYPPVFDILWELLDDCSSFTCDLFKTVDQLIKS